MEVHCSLCMYMGCSQIGRKCSGTDLVHILSDMESVSAHLPLVPLVDLAEVSGFFFAMQSCNLLIPLLATRVAIQAASMHSSSSCAGERVSPWIGIMLQT